MNSSALAEWALFVFGVITALIAVAVTRQLPKLFKGKTIQNVVDSANAIIEMYEKHVGALELKVGSLEAKIGELEKALTEYQARNEALQKLLLVSQPVNLPGAANEPVQK